MQHIRISLFSLIVGIALNSCEADIRDPGCDEGFLNPCIDIALNRPFTLKNRPDRAHPEGIEDIARFTDDNTSYRFILYEVHDYRCDECSTPSKDFYVKLAAIEGMKDTTWLYLGTGLDPDRDTPLTSPTQMQSDLGAYKVEFMNLERIPGDERLNLSTDYKEATFMIKQ